MQEQRTAMLVKNENMRSAYSRFSDQISISCERLTLKGKLVLLRSGQVSIKASCHVLPSSGESWEIAWTLDCIAAKKKKTEKRRLEQTLMGQGAEQIGGAEGVYSESVSIS